jgi:hypothetical protein
MPYVQSIMDLIDPFCCLESASQCKSSCKLIEIRVGIHGSKSFEATQDFIEREKCFFIRMVSRLKITFPEIN